MTRRPTRRGGIIAGAVAAIVAAGVTVAVVTGGGADSNLVAMFRDASPLIPGDTVRADGVKVGEISDITLHGGVARVSMEVDGAILPLHQDATATIRPVSLLGERYIDLNPGSAAKPVLAAGTPIGLDHTSASVDLDQILDTLNDPTSQALAALVTTLGDGVTGNSKNVAAALKALAPTMSQAHQLVTILDQQNSLISRLLVESAPGAKAFSDSKLDGLLSSAELALSTASANRTALAAAMTELPATLAKAQRELSQLTGVADSTTRNLVALKPLTGNLTQISGELQRFADAADPAIASLDPVLRHADSLLDAAGPVVKSLQSGALQLRQASGKAVPIGNVVINQLGDLIAFATGWSLATNGYDSISHYFRASVNIDANTIKLLAPDLLGALGLAPAAPKAKTATPAATKRATTTPGATTDPTAGATPSAGASPSTSASSAPPSAAGSPSATGLSAPQEQNLLGQLLGAL